MLITDSNMWRRQALLNETLSFHFEFLCLLALKTNHIVFWLGLCESSSQLFLAFHEVLCTVERTPHFPVPHLNGLFL